MSSYSQNPENPDPYRNSNIFWFIFLVTIMFLCLTACDISKKAFKTKSTTTTNKEMIANSTTSKFDFGIIDTNEYLLNYEPLDFTKIMWVITPRGDTLTGQNVKITAKKTKVIEHQSAQENTTKSVDGHSEEKTIMVEKQKEKTEKFNDRIILYSVMGLVVLGALAFFFLYLSMNKNVNAINALLQKL